MRLLIVTQTLDKNDPVLGFFHHWVEELAPHFESIIVVCLTEGEYSLPHNVRVYTLGKEKGRPFFGALTYVVRFKLLAWKLRHEYDRVFVHMNQEYVLIAGPLWKLLGKPVYLWRNHYAGSFLTDIAALFCKNVFCTSAYSYTAKYRNTLVMPVGVDLASLAPNEAERTPHSILFLARMAPSKRPDMLLETLSVLKEKGIAFSASFVGSPLPHHNEWYESLKKRAQELSLETVTFSPGIPSTQTPAVFAAHEFFVNTSRSGMLDKTMFEAAASGSIVLSVSADMKLYAGDELHFDTVKELAQKLEILLSAPASEIQKHRATLKAVAEKNSLSHLIFKLSEILTK